MSTRFVCGEAYGKVPIVRCDDLQLDGPRKNASGKEKQQRKENVMMWSVGHMRGLRHGTGLMVRWVQGIVGGDRAKVGEGCIGVVDVGGPTVYRK